jgi:hypothetical protein
MKNKGDVGLGFSPARQPYIIEVPINRDRAPLGAATGTYSRAKRKSVMSYSLALGLFTKGFIWIPIVIANLFFEETRP